MCVTTSFPNMLYGKQGKGLQFPRLTAQISLCSHQQAKLKGCLEALPPCLPIQRGLCLGNKHTPGTAVEKGPKGKFKPPEKVGRTKTRIARASCKAQAHAQAIQQTPLKRFSSFLWWCWISS